MVLEFAQFYSFSFLCNSLRKMSKRSKVKTLFKYIRFKKIKSQYFYRNSVTVLYYRKTSKFNWNPSSKFICDYDLALLLFSGLFNINNFVLYKLWYNRYMYCEYNWKKNKRKPIKHVGTVILLGNLHEICEQCHILQRHC